MSTGSIRTKQKTEVKSTVLNFREMVGIQQNAFARKTTITSVKDQKVKALLCSFARLDRYISWVTALKEIFAQENDQINFFTGQNKKGRTEAGGVING